MRIAALADLHGHWPEVPDCDVVVVAGDIIAAVTAEQERQQWIAFGHWCIEQVAYGRVVIGIAGNHDFLLRDEPRFARESLPWIYLEDSGIEFGGKKFYGTPWQPWFGGWAFNAPEVDPGEQFLREKFEQIPDDTDVLITHTPPVGFFDWVGGSNVGSSSLNRNIQLKTPELCIFGHIHNHGVEHVEGVTLCNAAYTKVQAGNYIPNGKPIHVFDV